MENTTNQRTEYERGYRDGYLDGVRDQGRIRDRSFPDYPARGPSCPKCGLKTEGVMGYVCGLSNCPLFPRATWHDPEWQKDHDRSKY